VVALVNEPACHIKAHPPHAVDSYIHVAPPLLASQHFSISGSWWRFTACARLRITLFMNRVFNHVISSPSVAKLTS
jgi:hypothetical protein